MEQMTANGLAKCPAKWIALIRKINNIYLVTQF